MEVIRPPLTFPSSLFMEQKEIQSITRKQQKDESAVLTRNSKAEGEGEKSSCSARLLCRGLTCYLPKPFFRRMREIIRNFASVPQLIADLMYGNK